MRASPGDRRPARPARAASSPLRSPLRWLVRLGPLQSWLVVMAVIVGLSLIGLRFLAWLVALAWLGYAVYTWIKPTLRRRLWRRWR